MRSLFRGLAGTSAVVLPLDMADHDKVSKDLRTYKDFENRPQSNETGMDRLYIMFSTEWVDIKDN